MILAQLSPKYLSYRSFGSLCRYLANLQWKFVVAAHKYKISRKCLKTTFVHDDRRKLTFYSTSFLSFKHSFLCSSLVEHSIVMSLPSFFYSLSGHASPAGSCTRVLSRNPAFHLEACLIYRPLQKNRKAAEQRPSLSHTGLRQRETCLKHTPYSSPQLTAELCLRFSAAVALQEGIRHGCKEGCFLRPLSLPPRKVFCFFSRRQIRSPRTR